MEEFKTKREFKFRAISLKSKKFVHGLYYTGVDENSSIIHYIISYSDDKTGYNQHEVDLDTLGQFTGLQDKNGKEIFEGDILKHHGVVAWCDHDHQWSVIDLNWNDKREWHNIDYLTSPFIVIGNIYENPELLK